MQLIEWFMEPRRYISSNDASNDRKYRLHFVDLMRIVLLRMLRLDAPSKASEQSGSGPRDPVLHELQELLTRIKQLVIDHEMLKHEQFDHILHDEILWLSSKRQSQSKRTSKVQTESEAIHFIQIVLEIRPQCLYQLATFSDSLRDQSPLDLAKRCRLHKMARFLQSAATLSPIGPSGASGGDLQSGFGQKGQSGGGGGAHDDSFENVSSESSAAEDHRDDVHEAIQRQAHSAEHHSAGRNASNPLSPNTRNGANGHHNGHSPGDHMGNEREMFLEVATPRNQKSKSLSINVNASRLDRKARSNMMTLPVDYGQEKRRRKGRSKSRSRDHGDVRQLQHRQEYLPRNHSEHHREQNGYHPRDHRAADHRGNNPFGSPTSPLSPQLQGHHNGTKYGRGRGGSTPGTGKRYHRSPDGKRRYLKTAKHHYSKSANIAPPAPEPPVAASMDHGYHLDVNQRQQDPGYEDMAPSVSTDISRARTGTTALTGPSRHRNGKKRKSAISTKRHTKSATVQLHEDRNADYDSDHHRDHGRGRRLRSNVKNEDNGYFIVDDKVNGALSPEAALPENEPAVTTYTPMSTMMNGGTGRRQHRSRSPRHEQRDMDSMSDWISRTELLEDENLRLKSDVRKLKKAVRDLTNTVQQIMQTLQQQ